MNYCSKCGKELQQDVKFCQYCGEKVEVNENKEENISNNQDNNVKINSTINETNSQLAQTKLKGDKKKKILIAKYCIGGFLILIGLLNIVSFGGILSILIGLSLMPFVYKILKEKKNIYFKGIEIVVPVLFVIFFGIVNSISSNDLSSKNEYVDNGESNITETTENETSDNSETQVLETTEEKWTNYYKENSIEVIDVDNETLYTYGVYYKDKTILTGVEIYDKTSTAIKVKNGDSDSIYYSMVFNFEDKTEIKKYKEGNKVVIIGEVSSSSTSKTLTLNKCHIVSSGTQAQTKIDELTSNKTKHIEYIENIKEEQDRKGEIGKGYIEILDAKVINSYGSNILVVSLSYKNNSDENEEFNYTANVTVFQNGIELNSSIMKCSWYDDKYKDNADVEIQPGITITVNKCFLIDDTSSDVDVKVEAWMFPSMYNKLNRKFSIK